MIAKKRDKNKNYKKYAKNEKTCRMSVSECHMSDQMIHLEQENLYLDILSSTTVRAGEYALPDEDALTVPPESSAAFEKADFGSLVGAEFSLGQMTVRYGTNSDRGLLAFLSYFGLPRRALVQSQTSRAVERLWGGKLRRRARYVVADVGWASTGRLARDFLLAAWRELSVIYRDLANRRAFHRASRIRVKPNNLPVTETGSAAAIAKRINPLGAPPHLVV
jgi:hypothetical protein